jgi:hypothetical protein
VAKNDFKIMGSFLFGGAKETLVRLEMFSAVIIKIIIFWNVTPCSLLEMYRRFGGTFCLCYQDR